MLVDVVAVRRMEVPVVQVIHVILVRDGGVPATITVHVGMIVMNLVMAHQFTFMVGCGGGAVK